MKHPEQPEQGLNNPLGAAGTGMCHRMPPSPIMLASLGFLAGISLAFVLLPYSTLQFSIGLSSALPPDLPDLPTPDLLQAAPSAAITQIAQQVTVRILAEPGSGSGVLVGRQGSTYTVLTSAHVIADSEADRYNILTSDGETHPAHRLNTNSLPQLDLALLTFESSTAYTVATLGDDKTLAIGSAVYAAGFPNYHFLPDQNLIQNTRDWGTKAYHLTSGEFSMRLDRPLPGGYGLGYTNEVEQGMSGGPVLDAQGRLIGINGRLKHPLQGINAYTFPDGTIPSQTLFQQMEALSWAVPIASFQQAIEQVTQAPR